MLLTFFEFLRPKILNIKIPLVNYARRTFGSKDKTEEKETSFKIVHPDPEDYVDLVDLMWETYFKEEPISKTLGITRHQAIDDYIGQELCKGHCFVAKTQDFGCIVGGCINSVACYWEAEELFNLACTIPDQKVRSLFKLLSFFHTSPNLWTECCTPKVYVVGQPFVHSLERCKGLGQVLVRCSIESATDCGYPLIRYNATGVPGQRIAEKLNLRLIHEIPYQNYIGKDKKPVVEPPPPNYSVKVYVARPFEQKK